MAPNRIGSSVLALDSETCLIRPGCLAPDLVCVTWQRPGEAAGICHQAQAEPLIRSWLEDESLILAGANIAYDMAVFVEAFPALRRLITQAYKSNRVTDVQIRQRLLDIAGGVYLGRYGAKGVYIKHTYDLEALAKRCAGMVLQKDEWRLSYGEFRDVPLAEWPARAVQVQARARETATQLSVAWQHVPAKDVPSAVRDRLAGLEAMIAGDPNRCTQYPLEDAVATLAVYQKQETHAAYLEDQYRKAYTYFALHRGPSAWGLRTDAEGVEILRRETQAAYDELAQDLTHLGYLRPDGSRDTKLAKRRMLDVCAREGISVRRTDGHTSGGKCKKLDGTAVADGADECEDHVCLDADACNATEDEVLIDYAEISTLKKVLSNDVEALLKGIEYPVHTRYGLAETGRTTSSKPNIQNLRRRAGIREAFVPRPGFVFAEADYPQLELYTLAQCCMSWLGQSELAKALNAGVDPHLAFAARILGISYEEAKAHKKRPDVDNARQVGKVFNFGSPGGLGAAKLVLFAKKTYGVTLTVEEAKELKSQWLSQWPEMPFYFARVNALCANGSNRAQVETLFTKRFRGNASFCAACNNGFQALGADCATRALCLIDEAQFDNAASPLFNTRTVAFVHDEFIAEVPDDARAHDAACELARLMVVGANEYLPDVPIPLAKMEPLLMRRWSKKAEACFDASGRLVAWE